MAVNIKPVLRCPHAHTGTTIRFAPSAQAGDHPALKLTAPTQTLAEAITSRPSRSSASSSFTKSLGSTAPSVASRMARRWSRRGMVGWSGSIQRVTVDRSTPIRAPNAAGDISFFVNQSASFKTGHPVNNL